MRLPILVCILVCGLFSQAEAKIKIPIPWGTDQEIHKIQPLNIPGMEDASPYLGYVTETTRILWIFGLSIENQGYALGEGAESENRGKPLSEASIGLLQEEGIVSSSLPLHPSFSFVDLVKGYSFWWTLMLLVGLGVWVSKKNV